MSNIGTSSSQSMWSNPVRIYLLGATVLLGFTGCRTIQEPPADEDGSLADTQGSSAAAGEENIADPGSRNVGEGERVVGQVTAIHESSQFVVIRSAYGRLKLPTGCPLEARGADGVRTPLHLSPEQIPSFVCADYMDSPPRVGDIVFLLAPIVDDSLDDAPDLIIPPPLYSDRD